MVSIFEELSNADDETLDQIAPPSAKFIDWLHSNAGTSQATGFHHRIGHADTDAAAGDHTHNGKDSKFLIAGDQLDVVTGSSSTADLAAAITQIQTILKRLGAT